MRDPERIEKILNLIKEVWSANPDMRLMQLLTCIYPPRTDLFYTEDEDFEARFHKRWIDKDWSTQMEGRNEPVWTTCPDEGRCHHSCTLTTGCYRVQTCEPLSAAYEKWPDSVVAAMNHNVTRRSKETLQQTQPHAGVDKAR